MSIRAGVLHGPIQFLSTDNPIIRTRIRDELAAISISRQAEELMPTGDYLEAMARLDHLADEAAPILRAAFTQDLSALGFFGKAIVHAENLWVGVQASRTGIRYFQPGSRIEIRIRYGRCRISYHHPFGKGRAQALDAQYTIGLYCNLLAEVIGAPSANVCVRYPGGRPEHEQLICELGRVSDCDFGMIEFDDYLLRSPLRRSAAHTAEIISDVVATFVTEPDNDPGLSATVQSLQSASLERQHRPLSQVEMSELLDMPVRTLQHTLKTEGVRFDLLRDKSRHKLARQALQKGREIEEVAHDVGFAHRQSFSEAFSKWEGCSPSEYRSRGHLK
jgi:AraC-like DNA-binding protein